MQEVLDNHRGDGARKANTYIDLFNSWDTFKYWYVLPSAVFLPGGLELMKAENTAEDASWARMMNTKKVISGQTAIYKVFLA